MVVIDLLISLGDTMCRYMSRSPSGSEGSPVSPRPHASEGRDSLLLALLHRANSVPRPASAKPGNRPATAGSRRLQEEWQTTPAGMADLALRWAAAGLGLMAQGAKGAVALVAFQGDGAFAAVPFGGRCGPSFTVRIALGRTMPCWQSDLKW